MPTQPPLITYTVADVTDAEQTSVNLDIAFITDTSTIIWEHCFERFLNSRTLPRTHRTIQDWLPLAWIYLYNPFVKLSILSRRHPKQF